MEDPVDTPTVVSLVIRESWGRNPRFTLPITQRILTCVAVWEDGTEETVYVATTHPSIRDGRMEGR